MCSGKGRRVRVRGRPFVPKIMEVKSTHDTIWNEEFLICLQNGKAKPIRQKTNKITTTTTKRSEVREDKTTHRRFVELEMLTTQFRSRETQGSIREGRKSESSRPRNQKPSPAQHPHGHESSWRIYSWPPISPSSDCTFA